jgi:hypothetical protein
VLPQLVTKNYLMQVKGLTYKMKPLQNIFLLFTMLLSVHVLQAQQQEVFTRFTNPPAQAKPWAIWYWLHGAVSKEGIKADLEAMQKVGFGGAYLMTIKDTNSKIPFQPQVRQLTPEWWDMVRFALQEAQRLKIEIGVHVSDGFALAGGPWIKPEMSMQKLVWTKTFVPAGNNKKITLTQPERNEGFYKEVAIYAYPANYKNEIVRKQLRPVVTSSTGTAASFLADETAAKQIFRADSNAWIQYQYPEPVTIRQVKVKKQNNAYQAQRLVIQKSEDGKNFVAVDTLHPPRHGWQDWDEAYTHAVKTFSSQYIRFVWTPEGSDPGSEDLDAAKWKPVLRVQGIYLSDEPVINNYEGKNGSVWRIARSTTIAEVNNKDAVPIKNIINLTGKLAANGELNWIPPHGKDWVVVRIGHTSTGYKNNTAGGGKGLETDKFSPEAITLQFNNWFAKFFTETDPVAAREVIRFFHMDSWECGSQNWSRNFAAEFKKKRGYDLLPYLVVMTGTPVTSAAASEKILHDVRQTITDLVNEKFYGTLQKLAKTKDCTFSAESMAPTFVTDGLQHYQYADVPMGEFWLNSPTHDKPNDMADAISGGHIYGKQIIGAEAFTTLRTDWGEHPGNLKTLSDRAFADGINKLSLHVFMHSPWLDKKPGMTLDGIGLFYQRDQTWFAQSKPWLDYFTRSQALLQMGKPVVDIAVFTGEDIPRRSVLPDRLMNTLPGLFGAAKITAAYNRLQNTGQPMRTMPDGVSHTANMADPELYIDALNGYKYDSFNPDVLLKMKVVNGRVVTPGGASYAVLVIPGKHPLNINATMSVAVKNKLKALAAAGAKIIVDAALYELTGTGFIKAPYTDSSFTNIGISRDAEVITAKNQIAWTHRKDDNTDIYFVANQTGKEMSAEIAFNQQGKQPWILDPQSGRYFKARYGAVKNNKTHILLLLPANGSLFVVFDEPVAKIRFSYDDIPCFGLSEELLFSNKWQLRFQTEPQQYQLDSLVSWTALQDTAIRYYSGTAFYTNTFNWQTNLNGETVSLAIDSLYNIATVKVNGMVCGTLWTYPYRVDITKAIKPGLNTIEIEVANTWRNRLKLDEQLPPAQQKTYHNSPYSLKNKPLLPAGITGTIKLLVQ